MRKSDLNSLHVLAIAPSSRGFGYGLLEGRDTLVDWGVDSVKGDKNVGCLTKVKMKIEHYKPDMIVLEDVSAEKSRRSPRIRRLTRQIVSLAYECAVPVTLFSREELLRVLTPDGTGTKDMVARVVAEHFPDELKLLLPPKRRFGATEKRRMGIFDAVALALAFFASQRRKSPERERAA